MALALACRASSLSSLRRKERLRIPSLTCLSTDSGADQPACRHFSSSAPRLKLPPFPVTPGYFSPRTPPVWALFPPHSSLGDRTQTDDCLPFHRHSTGHNGANGAFFFFFLYTAGKRTPPPPPPPPHNKIKKNKQKTPPIFFIGGKLKPPSLPFVR